jgi:chromosome partitioning protein
VANIACYLAAERGRRVLAIDMDPQGQLGKVLGLDVRRPRRSAIELLLDSVLGDSGGPESLDAAPDHGLPITHTRFPHLDVVVANKSLALFPGWTGTRSNPVAEGDDPTLRLANSLVDAHELGAYEFVLFDAPPSFGPLTLNVLRAADEVVIPVPLTYLALDGCAELTRTIATLHRQYGQRDLRITMVIPTFYRRTKLAHEILDRLKTRFPKEIAQTVAGFHVKVDEAQSRGLSIFEHAPRDRGAIVMAALAEELDARGRPDASLEGV